VTGNTGPDGNGFQVTHTWPEVAGRINVLFYSTSPACPFFNDRDTAMVWCVWNKNGPMLELAPGAGFELIGGPDNVARHPNHHRGMPALLDSLRAVAQDFAAAFPGAPLLGFNDLSLEWGGLFDIEDAGHPRPPDWTPPHCGHRFGMNCDLRISNLSLGQRRMLSKILDDRGLATLKHPSHWHLALRPQ
jgi:hypothetical protein